MSRRTANKILAWLCLFSVGGLLDQKSKINVESVAQKVVQALDGKPYHIEVIALKTVDKEGGKPLDGISARFVVRLVGGYVKIKVGFGEGREANASHLACHGGFRCREQGDTADDLMGLARKQAEHMLGGG